MALTLGVDTFAQPVDLPLFTGEPVPDSNATRPPTLADYEQALKNGFSIIVARLIQLGIPVPDGQAGYLNDALLKLCLPINARLAASTILLGKGDTVRGNIYKEQADALLAQLGSNEDDAFDLEARADSERNLPYGFGAGGAALGVQGSGSSGLPITDRDVYTHLLRILQESSHIGITRNDEAEYLTFFLQNLAQVALDGQYSSLDGRPTIPIIGANPEGAATGVLSKILIGATVYSLAGSGGGGLDSGTALPGAPALGDAFVLTQDQGSNPEGLYICVTAGSWTNLPIGLNKAEIEALFVPKDTDVWYTYGNDFAYWGAAGTAYQIAFFTGAPSSGNVIQFPNLNAVNISGVTHIRLDKNARTDANYFGDGNAAFSPAVGDVLYIHPDNPYRTTPYAAFTITGRTEGTGAGTHAWWELTGTMVQTGGNFLPGATGYFRITDEPPVDLIIPGNNVDVNDSFLQRLRELATFDPLHASALASFIASNKNLDPLASSYLSLQANVRDLINAYFARLDGSNLTNGFKNDVRSPSDPYSFSANYTRQADGGVVASDNQWALSNPPVLDGATVQMIIQFNATDATPAVERWVVGNEILIGTMRFRLQGYATQISGRNYQAAVKWIAGASQTGAAAAKLEADTPHRNEFATVAFSGDYDDLIDTPEDDIAGFIGRMTGPFNVNWVGGLSGTTGEGTLSTDNTVPDGAPPNTTALIAVDLSGVTDAATLNAVQVGELMLAKSNDTRVIAEIRYIKTTADNLAREYWFDPNEEAGHTLAYGLLADGPGTIAFVKQRPIPADLILDAADETRTSADRGKALAVKSDDENALELADLARGDELVATYTSLPDESQTWTDLPGTWADTDIIRINGVAQPNAGTQPLRTINAVVIVGNIRANTNNSTSSNRLWLVWADQQGARLQLRRKLNASTTLQICEAGPGASDRHADTRLSRGCHRAGREGPECRRQAPHADGAPDGHIRRFPSAPSNPSSRLRSRPTPPRAKSRSSAKCMAAWLGPPRIPMPTRARWSSASNARKPARPIGRTYRGTPTAPR